MPNFCINAYVENILRDRAVELAKRRLAYMTQDFPLTRDQVQTSVIIPELREAYRVCKSFNVPFGCRDWVYVGTDISGYLLNVHIAASRIDHMSDAYRRGVGPGPLDCLSLSKILSCASLHTDHLPGDTKIALDAWLKNALTEVRLAVLVETTVHEFIRYHWGRGVGEPALSTGVILARWPTLALLANHDDHWRARFAAPPVNLKRYGWRPEDRGWLAKYKKSMAVVDMALNSAVMLPPEDKLPKQEVSAKVVAWAKCEDTGDSNG